MKYLWLALWSLGLSLNSSAADSHSIELRRLIGSGGVVESYKDFLLTGDRRFIDSAIMSNEVALDRLNSLNITEGRPMHTEALVTTLERQLNRLHQIAVLVDQGQDARAIQERMPLNENVVINALNRWETIEAERHLKISQLNALGYFFGALLICALLIYAIWATKKLTGLSQYRIQSEIRRCRDKRLTRILARISQVTDTQGLAIVELDIPSAELEINTSVQNLFDAPSPVASLEDLYSFFDSEDRKVFASNLNQAVELTSSVSFELNQSTERYKIHCEPNSAGNKVLLLIQKMMSVPRQSLEDQRKEMSKLANQRAARITRLREGLKKAHIDLVNMQRAAHKDPLTGVFNRLGFSERLRAEVQRARRSDQTLGVLMVDIDRFKRINDTYGHAVGDNALIVLSNTLEGLVRSQGGDIVGRLGGDEFIVALTDANYSHAERTLKMARALLAEEPIPECPDQDLRIEISGGAVTLNPAKDEPGEVIKLADAALYRQKETRHQADQLGNRESAG